jgi:hypothetical protein
MKQYAIVAALVAAYLVDTSSASLAVEQTEIVPASTKNEFLTPSPSPCATYSIFEATSEWKRVGECEHIIAVSIFYSNFPSNSYVATTILFLIFGCFELI